MAINLLFVNERPFNPILGGIERVTDILAKALIARGLYSVYYLCGKVEDKDIHSLDYDFPTKMYTLPEHGLFKVDTNIEYYKELLEKHHIDIVVNQRGLNGGFNQILPVGDAKKVSVIHSKPNALVNHNVARILLFSNAFKEQLKKLIKISVYPFFYYRAIYKAKNMLKKAYYDLAQYSDAIVLLSENDKEEFLSNGVELKDKILCGIPNPNTFPKDTQYDVNEKEKVILYVGRFDQFEKNVLTLIKIWKRLFLKFPEWKLVLVGDGPDKKRALEYIEKNKIRNVVIEGAQKDVARYYRKASFVCLTSFYEGWGMTLTEGMSYGCIPCTFNNYGAASDIIDDGVNGCLIDAFNIKEYSTRLAEIMSSGIKREKMSRATLEKVKDFSVECVVERWEKLFLFLMEKRK